jgi:hypothetical protein
MPPDPIPFMSICYVIFVVSLPPVSPLAIVPDSVPPPPCLASANIIHPLNADHVLHVQLYHAHVQQIL